MELELRHLRVVCAIAETGSVTKAASFLGLAQPAVTTQLRRIERTLGGPLFDRDRLGARPTALGELVLARARVLLPAMRQLQEEAARLAGAVDTTEHYRIGAVPGPISGRLVHRFTTDHPRAHVTTCSSWSARELASMVRTGRLDYALVGVCGDAPRPDPGVTWQPVALDALFVVLPGAHPLAGRREVSMSELADETWAIMPTEGCFATCFAAVCARAGFTPRKMYELEPRGALELVEAGDAVTLCQATYRPTDGLVALPLIDSPLRWRHLLGWHPDAPAAGTADELIEYAKAAYTDAIRPEYAEWLQDHPLEV